MPDSSNSFEAAFILRPEPSRWLAAWWSLLHAVVAAAVLALYLSWPPALFALPAIVAHAVVCRPAAAPRLQVGPQRRWSLPERSLHGLMLAAGSTYTANWVDLVLQHESGRVARVLLVRDQLPAEDWRRLQALLRS
jgi:hypothetical protein